MKTGLSIQPVIFDMDGTLADSHGSGRDQHRLQTNDELHFQTFPPASRGFDFWG
ncbi:hypothetical protein [Lihuaxuella thermophila]|uniref:Uncharacterized protein n=1 Tax=Lihuaxuella thermophila TaxID=1173111 RepID=A0A1H8CXI6_9BACL|nr:hypothetical protein [Lihuaxuella thermophila]SEM98897.1 hypothetical protein SAMN05444955_104133 [Lihuaxuella thermophila]